MAKELSLRDIAKFDETDKKCELTKYKGSLSPYYNWIHMQEVRENEELQKALLYDTTDLFLHDLKWRIQKEMNFLIIHSGQQGSGKSSNAQYIGVYITDFILDLFEGKWNDRKDDFLQKWKRLPKFDASNVCMTRTEFVERVQTSIPLETVIFDEDQPTLIGIGSKLESETESRFEKCLRSTQINLQFCSPSTEEHVGNYYLEAFDKDMIRKKNRALVYVKDKDGFLNMKSNVKFPYTYIPGYKEKKDEYNIRLKDIQERDNLNIYAKIATWVLDNFDVYVEDDKGNLRQQMKNETIKNVIKNKFGERRFVDGQLKQIIGQMDLLTNMEKYKKSETK